MAVSSLGKLHFGPPSLAPFAWDPRHFAATDQQVEQSRLRRQLLSLRCTGYPKHFVESLPCKSGFAAGKQPTTGSYQCPYAIYREPPDEDLLYQGDILSPESLQSTLKGHQDYFVDRPYFCRYVVLTQTCDLDRTREMAEFIFLAVIRKFNDVFGMRHVHDSTARDRTLQLIRELYNHQPNKRGLFYLPKDPQYGIEEESVIDLRVMFSLHKASYPALLRARCCAIKDIYAAQLGYIAGQMFSRIAMPSWDEINPEIKLDDQAKNVRQSIIDREAAEYRKLKEKRDACFFDSCKESVSTYRWLPVRLENDRQVFEPHLLCKTHARLYEEIRAGRETGNNKDPEPA